MEEEDLKELFCNPTGWAIIPYKNPNPPTGYFQSRWVAGVDPIEENPRLWFTPRELLMPVAEREEEPLKPRRYLIHIGPTAWELFKEAMREYEQRTKHG